jgi:urease accessory protein
MAHQQLALLHLCDSLFPVGSFAHSDGLESAVAARRVVSTADLRGWTNATLTVTLGDAELPALRGAMQAVRANAMRVLAELDDEVDAMRPSAASREATRTMGTRLLKTWQQIRPSPAVQNALSTRARYTYPVAFGVVCAASDVAMADALNAYSYTRLAASVSAGMRLMPIGQHEAHLLLASVLRDVPAVVGRVIHEDLPPRVFSPLMDIASMSHQFVHSRLFRS